MIMMKTWYAILFTLLLCMAANSLTLAQGCHNSHEYVDLGLPSGLKWATMNVGASSPEDYGHYFAWGEVELKYDFNSGNSATFNRVIGNIGGNPQYDVARAKWGDSWRMPTKEEFQELLIYCEWNFTTLGRHKGYMVTGPNGNKIFFPAAGICSSDYPKKWAGVNGYYWSSTPYAVHESTSTAYGFTYSEDVILPKIGLFGRYEGLTVRPVTE